MIITFGGWSSKGNSNNKLDEYKTRAHQNKCQMKRKMNQFVCIAVIKTSSVPRGITLKAICTPCQQFPDAIQGPPFGCKMKRSAPRTAAYSNLLFHKTNE